MLNLAENFYAKIGVGLGLLGFSALSQAALPAAVAGAFTSLSVDVLALIDLAWTVAVPVTIGYVLLGMFSRTARAAVS